MAAVTAKAVKPAVGVSAVVVAVQLRGLCVSPGGSCWWSGNVL
jgi:hypothetical protein